MAPESLVLDRNWPEIGEEEDRPAGSPGRCTGHVVIRGGDHHGNRTRESISPRWGLQSGQGGIEQSGRP
jgi:hypothetical protein